MTTYREVTKLKKCCYGVILQRNEPNRKFILIGQSVFSHLTSVENTRTVGKTNTSWLQHLRIVIFLTCIHRLVYCIQMNANVFTLVSRYTKPLIRILIIICRNISYLLVKLIVEPHVVHRSVLWKVHQYGQRWERRRLTKEVRNSGIVSRIIPESPMYSVRSREQFL